LLEEDGIRRRSAAITLTVPTAVALYIANNKRQSLIEIEARHHLLITLAADDTLVAPECRIERTKTLLPGEGVQLPVSSTGATPDVEDDEPEIAEDEAEDETEVEAEAEPEEPTRTARSVPADDGEPRDGPRRRRRRRRRGEDRGSQPQPIQPSAEQQVRQPTAAPVGDATPAPASEEQPGEQPREGGRRRRRGRRGGRRRSGRGPEQGAATPLASDEQPQGLAESGDRQPEQHAERPAPLEIERPMVVTPPSPMPPSPMPETPSAPAVVVTGTGDEPGAETAEQPARVGWWRRKQS
jgi:ribonuclease E